MFEFAVSFEFIFELLFQATDLVRVGEKSELDSLEFGNINVEILKLSHLFNLLLEFIRDECQSWLTTLIYCVLSLLDFGQLSVTAKVESYLINYFNFELLPRLWRDEV